MEAKLMRWPWVSRSTYDADLAQAGADYDELYAHANERLASERRRYDALLDKYHALKLQGASVPEPKPALVPNKPQGPIAEAIDAVCERFGNSVKLRRRLMKYADDTKREAPDMDEADIAHSITHWKGPDDEEAA